VEILSGLEPGEPVIVEGNDRVGDGVPVQPVAAAPPAAAAGTPAAGSAFPTSAR
jgi:hypothetical protein